MWVQAEKVPLLGCRFRIRCPDLGTRWLVLWRGGVRGPLEPLESFGVFDVCSSTSFLTPCWLEKNNKFIEEPSRHRRDRRCRWIANSTLVLFMCVRFDKFRSASADRHLQSHEFSLAPMLAFALPGLHLSSARCPDLGTWWLVLWRGGVRVFLEPLESFVTTSMFVVQPLF